MIKNKPLNKYKMKTYIEVDATPAQADAIQRVNAILAEVELELIGTRPKRRP